MTSESSPLPAALPVLAESHVEPVAAAVMLVYPFTSNPYWVKIVASDAPPGVLIVVLAHAELAVVQRLCTEGQC